MRASVQPATYRRYLEATQRFEEWCERTRTPTQTDEEIDWALGEYLQEMYYEDDSRGQRQKGVMTRCGLQFFHPRLQGRPARLESAQSRNISSTGDADFGNRHRDQAAGERA